MNTTTITPETREKLLDLISIIEKVPDKEWDMDVWQREKSCGTVGCAAYHYSKNRPQSGLRILPDPFIQMRPFYGDSWGFDALASLFGITIRDSKWFFGPSSYPLDNAISRECVISRIREFLGDQP